MYQQNFISLFLNNIFKSLIVVIFDKKPGTQDPVTSLINIIVVYLGYQIDTVYWTQQLSLLFVGIIVLGSIRGLLLEFLKVYIILFFIRYHQKYRTI